MLLKTAIQTLKSHQKTLFFKGEGKKLPVFYSAARNGSSSKSSIDILMDFDSKILWSTAKKDLFLLKKQPLQISLER